MVESEEDDEESEEEVPAAKKKNTRLGVPSTEQRCYLDFAYVCCTSARIRSLEDCIVTEP